MMAPGGESRLNPSLFWVGVLSTVVFATCLLLMLASAASNHTPPPSSLASIEGKHFPLEISPDPIDLGILRPGQPAVSTIAIHNPGSHSIAVDRVETSCPCVSLSRVPLHLGPGETGNLPVAFNSSNDPDFEGKLSVRIEGHRAEGGLVFRTHVNLEVQSELETRSTRDSRGGK